MVLGHIHVNVQMKEHINLGKVSLKAVWEWIWEVHIDSRYTYDQSTEFSSHQYLQFQFMLYSILKAGLMLEATASNNFNRKPSLLLSLNYEEPQTMMEMCFHVVSSI